MKVNFKTILIVFLVALLGSGLGTFGVMSIYRVINEPKNSNSSLVINEATYTNKKETNYTQAIDKSFDTVVEITCTVQTSYSGYFFFGSGTQYATSSGSGVLISQDGYIVTNNHVVDEVRDQDSIKVKLYNGNEYPARIIGTDSRTDLALLKIEEGNLPYAVFADSSALEMGEEVIAIGNPLGAGISCSNGIISALEKEIYINNVYMTVIQTNAAVNEGNSGGGLFDLNGNIVGIVNAKKTSGLTEATVEGMGYAIPANTVKRIISEIMENGYVKDRAALGIKVYTGTSYYTTEGVIITEVIKGGSADTAGLQANDVIISVNDIEVNSYADLSKILDSKLVGDIVDVKILRNDVSMDFKVTLQQSVSN